MVKNVDSEPQDNRTLVLNWQPPAPTNGDILTYTVRISFYGNDDVVSEENVTRPTYTATNLSKITGMYITMRGIVIFADPGVPYTISITPVNLAGQGEILSEAYFTQELGE